MDLIDQHRDLGKKFLVVSEIFLVVWGIRLLFERTGGVRVQWPEVADWGKRVWHKYEDLSLHPRSHI